MAKFITRKLELSPTFREIDMMGVLHNCVYFEWFERGRLQIMNDAIQFAEIQNLGIAIPVLENSCTYEDPVRYGDKLLLITRHKVCEEYTGKLEFTHELLNINTSRSHAFGKCVCGLMDMRTFKLVRHLGIEIWERYKKIT